MPPGPRRRLCGRPFVPLLLPLRAVGVGVEVLMHDVGLSLVLAVFLGKLVVHKDSPLLWPGDWAGSRYMAVENPLQNAIFSVFSSSTDKEAVGFIHSPPTHFVYSARALILAIYIRCISVGFFSVEAPMAWAI